MILGTNNKCGEDIPLSHSLIVDSRTPRRSDTCLCVNLTRFRNSTGVITCFSSCLTEALKAENQRLREQLAEAGSAIEAIAGMAHEQIQSLPEAEETTEFLVEDAVSIVSPLGAEPFPQETTDRVVSEERKADRTKAIGISFGKTIDELVSGQKTQTRRAWQENYAKSFIRYFEEGIAIPALSKGRHRGGHELGHIRLTERPYQQYLSEMSPIDLQEEGGMVSTPQEFIDGFFKGQDKSVWVLHFEFEATASTANSSVEDTGSTDSPLGAKESDEFLVEDDWRSILRFNHFCSIEPDDRGDFIEEYRNWSISFCSSNGGIIAIDLIRTTSPEEMFTYCTEEKFHVPLDDLDDNLAWTKNIINQIEDFCPGQLSLNLNPEIKTEIELFPQEMIGRVELERKKLFQEIENLQPSNKGKNKKEKEQNTKRSLQALRRSLSQLEKFEQLKIGQNVWHNGDPEITGEITGFAFTTGGMPHVFVRWNSEGEDSSNISTEIVSGILTSDTVW